MCVVWYKKIENISKNPITRAKYDRKRHWCKSDRKFFIMIRNIFLGVQMAAEKEGKFQRRIFPPFFRHFHYAYNILDGTTVQKKEARHNLNLDLPLRSSLRILYFEGYISNKAAFLANIDRYNRAAFDFTLQIFIIQWHVSEIYRVSRARYIYVLLQWEMQFVNLISMSRLTRMFKVVRSNTSEHLIENSLRSELLCIITCFQMQISEKHNYY